MSEMWGSCYRSHPLRAHTRCHCDFIIIITIIITNNITNTITATSTSIISYSYTL